MKPVDLTALNFDADDEEAPEEMQRRFYELLAAAAELLATDEPQEPQD